MSTDQDTRASQPSLTRYDVAGTAAPRGVIVMLHGGKEASQVAVDDRSLSRRRSLAMQAAIAPAAAEAGLSTWLLSYRVRGWNGGSGPVADARWALEQVRRELGGVPVALLGHSMGGRTAVHVADDPSVTGVVGLAPWWPTDEPVEALAGKRLVAAHGRRDKITSYRATGRFVERARDVATSVEMHDMGPIGHYLLRRVAAWNEVALTSSLALLP
ncbi:MAG: alpha/beta fold hydrolase [Nocardioides sp.]